MANPTTNFGWVMPTSASLVTNLPADFNTFGQGVDTSMAQLKGGTTGQILSKTSATDMAFTWITNDVGDITAVTAGTGLSGGGTSGAVSLAIDSTVATLTGTQTLTNKTLTSPALTTPTISTLTTNGDTIYGTGSGAISRLGIGTTGQVLTVASGVPSWATPASTTPTFVGCSLTYLTNSQAISNTTYTRVLFDSEDYDTDSFHSNVTNNGRITIPSGKAGKYLFTGFHGWGNYGSTGRVIAVLYVNGVAQRSFGNETPSGYISTQLSCTLNLSVADYVELFVYQSSGATAYIQPDNELRFQANYLGA